MNACSLIPGRACSSDVDRTELGEIAHGYVEHFQRGLFGQSATSPEQTAIKVLQLAIGTCSYPNQSPQPDHQQLERALNHTLLPLTVRGLASHLSRRPVARPANLLGQALVWYQRRRTRHAATLQGVTWLTAR